MQGRIVQINISPGGLPKRPIPEVQLTPFGVEGDGWAHPKIHGGSEKAVLVICAEVVDALAARGYPLFYGALGENLTVSGLDPAQFRPGQRYRIGPALIELTRARTPCTALDAYGAALKREIREHEGWSGYYAAVIEPGVVRTHDIIQLESALV